MTVHPTPMQRVGWFVLLTAVSALAWLRVAAGSW